MEKKNNAVVKKVIIAVVVVVLLVAAIFLTKSFIDQKNEPSNGDVPSSSQTSQTVEPVSKPDYSEYVEQNPETVGWISIPGTKINFPVVQSVDNEYYLSHTFDHKSDKRGAIYMDYRNNAIDLDANTIIYGHNDYKDGSVFSEVAHYDDIEYYKEHPIIEFNTLESYYQWKIYAVFITNQQAYDDNGYIFNFIWPQMEGPNFKGYVEELNKRTLYYTGVDIKNGDRILTLSSCARNLDTAGNRAKTSIVVVARAVRPGEDPTVDVSKAYVNENPKYPQLYYNIKGIANPYKNDERWYPVVID
ncbi:MAG: class B sortase [Clostridia bacterium]|nr:class B sortase [Clostridia bacterium]